VDAVAEVVVVEALVVVAAVMAEDGGAETFPPLEPQPTTRTARGASAKPAIRRPKPVFPTDAWALGSGAFML